MECNCWGRQESMCKKSAGAGPRFQRVAVLLCLEDALQSKVVKARWWLRLPAGLGHRSAPDTRDGSRCISGFPHHCSSPAAFCRRGKPGGRGCRGCFGESCGDCKAKRIRLSSTQPIVDRFPDCRSSSGSSRITGGGPVEEPKATLPGADACLAKRCNFVPG